MVCASHYQPCTSILCRTAFDFVRKHGIDAVRLLRLPRNRGKGAAVKAGCLVARGRRVLFMDADGATRVSDMERLEARLAEMGGEEGESGGESAFSTRWCRKWGIVFGHGLADISSKQNEVG